MRDNEATLNEGKEGTVNFIQPELIITEGGNGEDPPYKGTKLQYPIKVKGVLEFIQLNRKYLMKGESGVVFSPEGKGDASNELKITKFFKQVAMFDADIIEFDDEFKSESCESELVFSLIANRYVPKIESFGSSGIYKKFHLCSSRFRINVSNKFLSYNTILYCRRSQKRFTITFRGSVSTKDWAIDASIGKISPEFIQKFAGKKVKFHKGFASKYNQI